ncbi:hypothetical protein HN615_12745 [Candidatus Woesearchaeota archaeon]|jgi:hypothetical protein|nr:hypothetical protein [Candidatus Woesearchaeota archaeon]
MSSDFIESLKRLKKCDIEKLNIDSKVTCFSKPFFLYEIKDFLNEKYYKELYEAFPSVELFDNPNPDKGYKKALDGRSKIINDFLLSSSIWGEFTDTINTHETSLLLKELFHDNLPKRELFKDREWFTEINYYSKKSAHVEAPKNVNLIRYSFEFSHLENGAYIPPHTDSETKLITMIMYFPDPCFDWSDKHNGTYFYRPKDPKCALSSWESIHLEGDRLAQFRTRYETLYHAKFEPNKLLVFLKSDESWHEVKKITGLKTTRKAFIVNVFCR